jgi:quercetin dioxygenase-like cupin family protein
MSSAFQPPRRYITGVNEDGTSSFVGDEVIEPRVAASGGGLEVYLTFESSLPLELPPREGSGFRVNIIRFLAGESAGRPFSNYHWHDTLDVAIVISGSLAQKLDDGTERVLRPGDVLVSGGCAHGWEARGDDDAVVALIMSDAKRVGVSPPPEKHITKVIPR